MSNETEHESGAGEQPRPNSLGARALRSRYARLVQGDGLRAKALRGASWTVVGFATSQVIRLASNLVITRLLFPEAFGLMLLAQVFLEGLTMFSDFGIGASIVHSKRGEDPNFLATAWTMQVIRGFVLFLGMCLLAYPISTIYGEPLLFPILTLIGVTTILAGFGSIGLAAANRKMVLGPMTIIELASQVAGIAMMITWAIFSPTVWALVGGGLFSATVRLGLEHKLLRSAHNRFCFERAAAKEIFHFGKWIFLATAMTYFAGRGLILVQGKLVPLDVLAMISIAGMLSLSVKNVIARLAGRVLFPTLSEVHRLRPHALAAKFQKARLMLFAATLPIFSLLILFGDRCIYWLYDDRYGSAGPYLLIISLGGALTSLRTPFGMALIAVGDTRGHSINMGVLMVTRVSGMILGFSYGGVVGMLLADILAEMCVYPIEAWRLRKHGLWSPLFDFLGFSVYVLVGCISWFIHVG